MNYFQMSIWIVGCLFYVPLFLQNPLSGIVRFIILGMIVFHDPLGLIPNKPPVYAQMDKSVLNYHWKVYKEKVKKNFMEIIQYVRKFFE
jgi:hypothetical protein